MTEQEINNELERTRSLQEKNDYIIRKVRYSFNTVIKTGDKTPFLAILDSMNDQDYIESGETRRIGLMAVIYQHETEKYGKNIFCANVESYEELYDKYIKTILMLRRVEQGENDVFADEAYSYLEKISISPEALITILSSEYFEKKKEIAIKTFLSLEKTLDDNMKIDWIDTIKRNYLV